MAEKLNQGNNRGRVALVVPLLKAVVALAVVYMLYKQLFIQNDFVAMWSALKLNISEKSFFAIVLVIVLMPVNIVLEAIKFRRLLVLTNEDVGSTSNNSTSVKTSGTFAPSVFGAVKRVCAGLTIGIITPNRIGEYAGRMLGDEKGQRTNTIFATLIGGLSQWLPLLIGGLVSVFVWYPSSDLGFEFSGLQLFIVAIGGIFLFIGFVFIDVVLVMAMSAIRHVGPSLQWMNRWKKKGEQLATQLSSNLKGSRYLLGEVVLLSCARYLVYLVQISLTFSYFGLTAPIYILVSGTALILLLQTFIPLPSVIQAMARIELAALIWQDYSPIMLGLSASSVLIFVLNLGIPALVGLGLIISANVEKTLGYETP